MSSQGMLSLWIQPWTEIAESWVETGRRTTPKESTTESLERQDHGYSFCWYPRGRAAWIHPQSQTVNIEYYMEVLKYLREHICHVWLEIFNENSGSCIMATRLPLLRSLFSNFLAKTRLLQLTTLYTHQIWPPMTFSWFLRWKNSSGFPFGYCCRVSSWVYTWIEDAYSGDVWWLFLEVDDALE